MRSSEPPATENRFANGKSNLQLKRSSMERKRGDAVWECRSHVLQLIEKTSYVRYFDNFCDRSSFINEYYRTSFNRWDFSSAVF